MLKVNLDKNESLLLIDVLDFYSRMWMGQYDALDTRTGSMSFAFGSSVAEKELTQILLQARSIIIPQLRNTRFSSSLGIWSPATDDRAISAYDMQQIIRHARSWYLHPEGGSTRNFDAPILEGSLPVITCVCSGEGNEFDAEITMHDENLALMLNALGIYKHRQQGDLLKLMEHYTNDSEALALAKQATAIYKTINSKDNGSVLSDIDSLCKKVNTMLTYL